MTDEQKDIKTEGEVEEIVPEEGADVVYDDEATPVDQIKKLREKVKELTKEKQEYLDGWQRARADYQNFKKQTEDSRKDMIKFATEGLLEEIIPALDAFDLAMGNKVAWEKVDANWRKGIEYIYAQLVGVLDSHGLKQFDPMGEKLDTTRHEPTDTIETTNTDEDGKVLAVLQKGYDLGGKIIRPAKVKVGELKK